jgi:hypothetical protein
MDLQKLELLLQVNGKTRQQVSLREGRQEI